MLSNTQNKYIRSLSQQKFRKEYKVFIAEGNKVAKEWLHSDARVKMIVALPEWLTQNYELTKRHPEASLIAVTESELNAVSGLTTPNEVVLVIDMPEQGEVPVLNEWCLALDNIQDPGNMGTIIRIADWFGIKHILCSHGCVDIYNPKVVQSAMGSHLRVKAHPVDLERHLSETGMPIIAATLNGENVHEMSKIEKGILVIGNESKGVSDDILKLVKHKVTIPGKGGAESLNAAVSTGILCALLIG